MNFANKRAFSITITCFIPGLERVTKLMKTYSWKEPFFDVSDTTKLKYEKMVMKTGLT